MLFLLLDKRKKKVKQKTKTVLGEYKTPTPTLYVCRQQK